MISLKLLLATLAVLSIWSILPTATRCDTPYYEQYYSARRFQPLKKSSLVQVNLTVSLAGEKLQEFEKMAVIGDARIVGSWQAKNAVMMNKSQEYGKWKATLWMNVNASISYRYFVAAQDKRTGSVQVRRWESAIETRSLIAVSKGVSRTDTFGVTVPGGKREIQHGWLNAGHIIQLKLFRNCLQVNGSFSPEEQHLRIKVTAMDPQFRTAIVSSARANVEYVLMEYGNSFLRPQPAYGVTYRGTDIIMFHISVNDLQDVAYLVEVYVQDAQTDVTNVIGYHYIANGTISGTEGEISGSLLSPTWKQTIGVLKFPYVVIHPLRNSSTDLRTSFVHYWRNNWTGLEIGHRGMGRSLKTTKSAASLLENSLASMTAVAELGGDLVEFDVQLTKDLVPIIYHDFSILVCIESKTPTSLEDLTEVMIKDITYEQLKDFTTYQVVGTKVVEYSSPNSVTDEMRRLFPTFEDFLTKVNRSVGFDIEIKWPQLLSTGAWESAPAVDKNIYVDRILDVMLKHGCGRFSFFTSFDVDICSMLRFKQNMYPVMFLSPATEGHYADPRSHTFYDSVNNAQAFDLVGVVPNAAFIKNNPEWVDIALRQHKKVFVWGTELKDRASIDWFFAQNVTGAIYDHIDLHLKANKTSAFYVRNDLPEFFKLQCPPLNRASEENITITNILSNINML